MLADERESVLTVHRAVHGETRLREDGRKEGPDVFLILDHDRYARFFHRCTFRRGEPIAGARTSVMISQNAVWNLAIGSSCRSPMRRRRADAVREVQTGSRARPVVQPARQRHSAVNEEASVRAESASTPAETR